MPTTASEPQKKRRMRNGLTPEQRTQLHLERILNAAIIEFTSNGYNNTSVANIVARARVSRSTFYEHFSDREDCLLSVMRPVLDALVRAAKGAVANETDPAERARAALRAAVCAAADDRDHVNSLLIEIHGGSDKAVSAVVQAQTELGNIINETGSTLDHQGFALAGAALSFLDAHVRAKTLDRLLSSEDDTLDRFLRVLVHS